MEENQTIILFWQSLSTACVGIIVTLLGFWATVARKIISKDEISHMILHDSPYSKDRESIMDRLATTKEVYVALSITLQKVIEVMNELRVQIATLSITLNSLEGRIDIGDYKDRERERDDNRDSHDRNEYLARKNKQITPKTRKTKIDSEEDTDTTT